MPAPAVSLLEEQITPTGTFRRELVKCGKPTCWTCAKGPAHGPYWYVYWKQDGRTFEVYRQEADQSETRPVSEMVRFEPSPGTIQNSGVTCVKCQVHNGATKYGYARVPTDDQNPALQLVALKKAGCQTVFKDEGSSGATTKRPALTSCLKRLEHGDTLIVWKLDRLGRSLRDLITMLDDLRARGVKFHSLTEAIDTATPTGRAMWQMIGVLAELEGSFISERTRAGVKAAQRRGVKFDRKVKLTPEQIAHARRLIDKGEARQYVADLLNVGRSTLYRALS